MCYDLAHQIRCAKHTFSGRCDITPMVCCSFGGHSTPQFLQCSHDSHTTGLESSLDNVSTDSCLDFFTKFYLKYIMRYTSR